jgi:TPR repeat protein
MVGATPGPLQGAASAVGNGTKPLWSRMSGAKSVQEAPTARMLHSEEIAALYQRGEQLIAQSDIAAARLMFARAAKVGDARSALALGASYDPDVLKKLGVIGVAANEELARDWYAKASGFGSREAAQRIVRPAQLR